MLPDFPSFKRAIRKALLDHLNKMIEDGSFVSRFRKERHFEGDEVQDQIEAGGRSYAEFASAFSVPTEKIIADGPMAFGELLPKMADDFIAQKARHAFAAFEKMSNVGGPIRKIHGLPRTFDEFLAHYEKFPLTFNDDGTPNEVHLMVAPGAAEVFERIRREWMTVPENQERLKAVIDRKRREWNDRESNRELVD